MSIVNSNTGGDEGEIFVAKFLRSAKGFQILKDNGWLEQKMKEWKEAKNVGYIQRLEKSLYDGLNMTQLNSGNYQNYALNIWIPTYENNSDFRNELMLFKRVPF